MVGVKLLGRQPDLMAPPCHTSFAFWYGTRIMSWAQRAMTVGHCAIHLSGCGRYKPPAVPWLSPGGGPGARPLEAPKNLHLKVRNSGSDIAQQ